MILKTLEDLQQSHDMMSGNIRPSFQTPTKTPKGRSSGVLPDGRRCSSAGIGEGSGSKRGFSAGNYDDSSVALKKERKRKRAESVDSIKAVNASINLMPPPLITSAGEVTTSGSQPSINYSFMEGTPNGAPALRPITLNVKPIMPTSTTNCNLSTKSPSGSGKKTSSAVSSSAGGPKSKLEGKIRIKNSTLETNGGPSIPGNSKFVNKTGLKVNKISSSKGPLNAKTAKLKIGGQVTSSSSLFARSNLTISSPPVSSSTLPPGAASPNGSVTSSKAQLLNNNLKQLPIAKKKGIGLSAVIDKLRGSSTNPPSLEPSSTSPTNELGKAESSYTNNRPDSSSGKSVVGNNKLVESKVKYSRAEQFTVKQGGALKLTVTKTKPGSSSEFKSALKIKTPSSSGIKSPASSSSGVKPTAKGAILKRPVPTYKTGPPFKGSFSGGVSSSSSSALVSPKSSTGVPVSPKLGIAGRTAGSGKVSSSGSGAGSSKSNKISSSSGAGAILNAALPPLRIDQLPKIPRTAQASAAALVASAAAAAASSQVITQSSQPPSQSISSPLVNTSAHQPTFRRTGPPNNRDNRDPRQEGAVSSQQQQEPRIDSFDRFQSNAITSSLASQIQAEALSISSSGGAGEDNSQQQPQSNSNNRPVAVPTLFAADNGSAGPALPGEKAGVSSSSDAQATSTPSSPAEAASISDVLQNAPLIIIPTESFDEPDRVSDTFVATSQRRVDTPSIDSTDNLTIASTSGPREGITSTSNNGNTLPEPSLDFAETIPSTSSATKDDEEDEDGLVIDFNAAPKAGPESEGELFAQGDPVSSSNVRIASLTTSSSSSPAPTRTKSPSPAASSFNSLMSPCLSPPINLTPSFSGSSGSAHPISPPSQSASVSRRSPYSIDDDLMDEALVISGE